MFGVVVLGCVLILWISRVLIKHRATLNLLRMAVLAVVGSVCLPGGQPHASAGSQDDASVYAAKAKLGVAFTLNFVRWSSLRNESGEEVLVCVDCAVPVADLQAIVEGKAVGNSSVLVVEGGPEGKGSDCRAVLYCEDRFPKDTAKVRALGKRGILVVGFTGAMARGGMIELYTNSEDKVRFHISMEQLDEAHIKMESRVLDLADR